ncbi:hypothetical protein HZS_2294 [Henneguya salminicola]|nr:hypothetical protein HZS_2294 [Henneguya salminicola]
MNAHPNLSEFVIAIRTEFEFYSERCHQIRNNNKSIKYDNDQSRICNMEATKENILIIILSNRNINNSFLFGHFFFFGKY